MTRITSFSTPVHFAANQQPAEPVQKKGYFTTALLGAVIALTGHAAYQPVHDTFVNWGKNQKSFSIAVKPGVTPTKGPQTTMEVDSLAADGKTKEKKTIPVFNDAEFTMQTSDWGRTADNTSRAVEVAGGLGLLGALSAGLRRFFGRVTKDETNQSILYYQQNASDTQPK